MSMAQGAMRRDAQTPAVSPIEAYLRVLHARLLPETAGEVATYIPELGHADPMGFGICVATVDGHVYAVGEADAPFTIQSMSKPFTYGEALRLHGTERVLRQVGVEPTGETFNAIVLDERANRPFNPMVNAGAIAVADLMAGEDMAAREASMLALFGRLAGRPLGIDRAVFASERDTGHRNRAIAWLMLNSGMIARPPEEVLDLYFRQCSVLVTCRDMAVMAATLANRGVNPRTDDAVYEPDHVRDVLTLMSTCGMYNYAGQWAFDVGMPAKSGVSGGVIAVIPGQAGIAVWSPPLDAHGNSVRGVAVCKELSRAFSLHAFSDRTSLRSVIRREYSADAVHSKRMRSAAERAWLRAEGGRLAVIEAQGALFFGSAELLIRRMLARAAEAGTLIVDFRRVSYADPAACELIAQTARGFASLDCRLEVSSLPAEGPLRGLRAALEAEAVAVDLRFHEDADIALEKAENAALEGMIRLSDDAKYALGRLDILKGLSRDELRLLEQTVSPFQYAAGETIVRAGDEANALFIIARGSASIWIDVDGGRRRRVGSVGPGYTIGEMALVEGGRRSADVCADEAVICYALSLDRLRALSVGHPNIMIVILGNIVASLSDRLRHANAEIRSLG